MGTRSLRSADALGILHGVWNRKGWALCIGAGTSLPVFPNWSQLVAELLEAHEADKSTAATLAKSLLSQFGADALIQASFNRVGKTPDEFTQHLSQRLYGVLTKTLTADQWDAVSFVLARPGKKGISKRQWRTFLSAFRDVLPRTSALDIAAVLTSVLGTKMAPAAVLSFNAEPLLFALVNALTSETAMAAGPPTAGQDRQWFDLITRSISNRQADRVPYIFCHGLLPVPTRRPIATMASVDKLVFSEGDYLQLANSTYSWQSSAFLDVAGSRRVVFVGVSFSDPNMRRWLSWQHENRTREISAIGEGHHSSTQHLWLRVVPAELTEMDWIEAAVEHLGVRVVWMDSWSETGRVLKTLLEPPAPRARAWLTTA